MTRAKSLAGATCLAASWLAASSVVALGLASLLLGCHTNAPERIDALLAPLRGDTRPGVAVMVIRNGAALYTATLGMADLEKHVPIGPRTAFDIASDAKQFTGMLAMILHEEGRLDYDAPVDRFLPDLSRFGDRLTVRHLLTHTSGLPDYYDALAAAAGAGGNGATGAGAAGFVTNRDALAWLARQGDLLFAPGDRFQYSDAGYEMLALVLEKAAGEPFGDLLRRRIFEPLGMNDTRLRDRPDVAVPNRARGYVDRGLGFVAQGDHPLDCLVGSGAINTTIEDLARWDGALASDRLVKRATVEEALQPMRLNDGTMSPYGFGWFLKEDHGHRRLEHPGAWLGYQAFIARYPEDRFTVILLANRSDLNLGDLADRIVRICAGSVGAPY